MKRLAAIAVIGALIAACGPKSMFHINADDSDRGAIAAALAQRQAPPPHAPRVFVAQSAPGAIVAYDLAAGKVAWKANADVKSRIWVGGDFIVAQEGTQLVARDKETGASRWGVSIDGELVGAAADRERAYLTWHRGAKWYIAGYAGSSGKQLWEAPADAAMGAPIAQGGIVYAPYLSQWLLLVDGKSGELLARMRGIDQQISTMRVTSRTTYFGSNRGLFELRANGEVAFSQVKIPPQLERTSYGVDLYDHVQTAYTAADRARVLWSSLDAYGVHYFRYVFGFNPAGELVWAYSHPRVELVASEHTGRAIVCVSVTGDVVAIDPATGAVRALPSVGGTVLGAAVDAEDWSPAGGGQRVETVAALVSIARDHDARFDRVKELAIASLAKLPGVEVTKELLGLLADSRAPLKLKDTAVELLAQRKDPDSLGVLTAQLAVHADYLAKTTPDALGAVAKAIASLAGAKLDPAQVTPALDALQSHLDDPATQTPDLVMVIRALTAIGGGAERRMLASHLLLYHTDDEVGGDESWQKAIVAALAPSEQELLRQVAADPRTKPGLAAAIKDARVKE